MVSDMISTMVVNIYCRISQNPLKFLHGESVKATGVMPSVTLNWTRSHLLTAMLFVNPIIPHFVPAYVGEYL